MTDPQQPQDSVKLAIEAQRREIARLLAVQDACIDDPSRAALQRDIDKANKQLSDSLAELERLNNDPAREQIAAEISQLETKLKTLGE